MKMEDTTKPQAKGINHVQNGWNKVGDLPTGPLVVEEDKLEPFKCFCYSRQMSLTILCYALCVLTAGLLLLLFYWKPNWGFKMTHRRCHPHEAEAVLIEDIYQREHVKYIQRLKVNDKSDVTIKDLQGILKKDVLVDNTLRFFRYQRMKYIWDPERNTFFLLRASELITPCKDFFRDHEDSLSDTEVVKRQAIFGLNKIDIDVKPIFVMLVQEALNPFYVFQIFSVTVWMVFEYWSFSVCIILMTMVSLTTSLYVTRKGVLKLHKMAESNLDVQVLRPNNNTVVEKEDQLVPGDIIVIPPQGCVMTCDAVLINGSCIVNESMLTGESVPLTKVSLSRHASSSEDQERPYSPVADKRHTLFCGTQIIQTRQSEGDITKAVVVQTGFATMKGTLVRSILYPRPMEFKLHRDAMMFVGSFLVLACIGVAYSVWIHVESGMDAGYTILVTCMYITIAVQPLLPVALTTGMVYAQLRLKKQRIFCISPHRINLCGVLDVVCFDKTGTLTVEGLDLLGCRRVTQRDDTGAITFSPLETDALSLPPCAFTDAMATCHSLAIIDGQLKGDPMDLKMFQATGWTLTEDIDDTLNGDEAKETNRIVKSPSVSNQQPTSEYVILKQFTFSSSLQRMSVIARSKSTGQLWSFVKGSPEMIMSLSTPSSVPDNFRAILDSYTLEGFRVLAIASKLLDTEQNYDELSRNDVESGLTFAGLLVWQNRLKPESLPVITELREANIRTIMVTGDNILTAISVAGKCGMLRTSDNVSKISAHHADNMENKLAYTRIARDVSNKTVEVDTDHADIDPCTESLIDTTGGVRYALDGETFEIIRDEFPESLSSIIVKASVFARMSPNQKQSLIEALQKLDYCVGMCGDGANDCGALKTAHVGISLSEAEASVASPFTSQIQNVSCVPMIIKDGRSALVTSFGLFKYIVFYTMIMYVTSNVALKLGSQPSNMMFLVWDVIISTTIVLLMGRSGPYHKIADRKPPSRLLRASNMFSLTIHIIILTISQTIVLFLVKKQEWYEEVSNSEFSGPPIEVAALFLTANFQYVFYAFLFTPGEPFRASIKSNPLYVADLILLSCICTFLLFCPVPALETYMEVNRIPDYMFRLKMFAIVLTNCAVSFMIEKYLIPRWIVQKMIRCWREEKVPKYKRIEMEGDIKQKLSTESVV